MTSRTLLAATGCLALAASSAFAQERVGTPGPVGPRHPLAEALAEASRPAEPVPDDPRTRPAPIREEDGAVLMHGPGYRARLTDAGLRFEVQGRRFGYRLRTIEAGGAVLFDARTSAPSAAEVLDGDAAGYDRGNGLQERYELRRTGVEQLFRIEGPLPAGADLRIAGRYRCDGLEAARVPGRGVVFCEPARDGKKKEAFAYGEPTLIDAEGRSVRGELLLEGDALVLSFAAAALEGLSYPLTVDPLIGSNFLVRATSNNERSVAIAWNSTQNEFLFVWDVQISGSDWDVWGQRMSTSGSAVGSAFVIRNQASVIERYPDVAYSASTGRYVLTMEYGTGDVIQQTMTYTGTYVGAWYLDNNRPPTGYSQDPRIIHQSGDTFLFTWSDNNGSGTQWVMAERRNSNATIYNDDWGIQSLSSGTAFRRPDVGYSATQDDFYFVWEHPDGSARSVQVTGDLLYYVGQWPSITLSANGIEPAVTWNIERDEYQVAWADNVLIGGDYDLFLQRVSAAGATAGFQVGGIRVIDDFTNDQREPALAYGQSPDESLVVYRETYSGSDRDIYAYAIRSDGVRRGSYITINAASHDTLLPDVAFSPTSLRFMAGWEDNRSTTSYDVYAQILSDASPDVLESDPPDGATNVPTDYSVKIHFSDAMNAGTISGSTCKLVDQVTMGTVSASVTYASLTRTATIDPSSSLVAGRDYEIQVTTGAQDPAGNALASAYAATFTAGAGAALLDSDGDGLLDLEEPWLGTSTSTADTDGDSLPDTYGLFFPDALRTDSDGDGNSDYVEFLAGTDPLDPNDGGVPGYDITPPSVVSFSPPGGAANARVDVNICLTFDEPIATSTVDYGTNLTVKNGANLIAGSISFSNGDRTICLDPTSDLPTSATIQTTVFDGTGAIEDLAGNELAATYLSSFTTESSTSSPSLALNEPLHHPSFSEPVEAGWMNRASGSGGVPDHSGGLPEAAWSTPGFGESCSGCGSGSCGFREGDLRGTGVNIFGKNRSVVTLHNGAFIHGRIDWSYPDRSLHSVTFARTYRSNMIDPSTSNPFVGLFGYRTVLSWETRLIGYAGTGSGFTLLTPDGRFYTCSWTGSTWALPTGFYGSFHLDGSASEVKLIFRNGLIYAYRTSDGRLKYVRDRNGNQQTCSYSGSTLTTVTDATGRDTTFTYTSGRITTITTFDGLEIDYGYNGSAELTSVTLPATDEFVSGRQETYAYVGDHLMSTLTNGRGETYLTNHYDPVLDVVNMQDHIDGTHLYFYELNHSPGVRTTHVDREGNVTEVEHDATGAPETITQYSRGLNELDSATEWETSFTHNGDGEVTKVVYPRGNVHQWTYDGNGYVTEHRRKTADAADSDANDIVEKWKIDPSFGVVLRYMEPRANEPGISAAQKVAYTRFYFYDHEDILLRLELETSQMGATVAVAGDAQKTYGRTGSGQFPAETGTTFDDNDGDGLADRGGNLWFELGPAPLIVDRTDPDSFESSRQVIETFYSVNEHGQPLIAMDPGGDVLRWQYYSGPYSATTSTNAGYLRYSITDSGLTAANLDLSTGDPTGGASEPNGKLALITTFAYDERGNLTSLRSPRGFGRTDDVFHTRLTYDDNNLLRTRTVSAPFNYQWSYLYDGNQMVIEERTPNIVPNDTDDDGIQDGASEQTTGSPSYFSRTYAYCVCNHAVAVTEDASGLALTTHTLLDLNQRATETRHPEGNTETVRYDERDLAIRTVAGANDTGRSSMTRMLYDGNANLIEVYDDDTDVDTSDTPTTFTYDLFDRQTEVTDELGNESESVYDKGSFVRQTIFRGPDAPGGGSEVLAQTFMEYDEAGRLFQTDRDHFDAVGNVSLADGSLTPPVDNDSSARGNLNSSVVVYDAEGHAVSMIDDNLHETQSEYDGADRVTTTTDPMGNVVGYAYDKDSNTILVIETEQYDVGSPTSFLSRTFYDELGRAFVGVTSLGNTTRSLFDSRSNVVQTSDAQADSSGTVSQFDTYSEHDFSAGNISVSGRGNRVEYTYDALSRLTATARHITLDSTGDETEIDEITTTRGYDRNSRLTTQTDDNGNTTTYYYDALNRRMGVENADGTAKLFFYDRASNLRQTRDERQVVVEYEVDELGRTTEVTVSQLPFGPGQTSFGLYSYDGLSRMVKGENNHSILELRYDSLGPVLREKQTVNTGADRTSSGTSLTSYVQKEVLASYDGVGNRTQLTYPGSTVINETYDANDRRKLVKDGTTTIAEYMYAGPGYRVLEKRLPEGNITLYREYDGQRRVTRHDQRRQSDGMRIAGYTYVWDRVGNRWYERTLTNNTTASETSGDGEAFAYDSVYRMIDYFQGATSASLNSLSNNTPRHGAALSYDTYRRYDLDGVGNRIEHKANGVVEEVYALEGDDASTNQYTFINDTFQSYDPSGNLLHDGEWAYAYSYRNQLLRAVSGSTDARYRHDVLGRRVSKRLASGNFPGWSYGHSVYIHSGTELIEEYDTSGNVRKEWVYGIRIDEPIRQRAPDYADIDTDTNTSELQDLYYLSSSIGTITALVDTSGVARERYVDDVWGSISDVLDKNGSSTGASWTLVGNPWVFADQTFSFEERLLTHYGLVGHYFPTTGQLSTRLFGGLRFAFRENPANARKHGEVDGGGSCPTEDALRDWIIKAKGGGIKASVGWAVGCGICDGKPTLFVSRSTQGVSTGRTNYVDNGTISRVKNELGKPNGIDTVLAPEGKCHAEVNVVQGMRSKSCAEMRIGINKAPCTGDKVRPSDGCGSFLSREKVKWSGPLQSDGTPEVGTTSTPTDPRCRGSVQDWKATDDDPQLDKKVTESRTIYAPAGKIP